MKEVEQNVGKKVRFHFYNMQQPIIGTIMFDEYSGCTGCLVGYLEGYSVRYDEVVDDKYTFCSLDEETFRRGDIVSFDTIEE